MHLPIHRQEPGLTSTSPTLLTLCTHCLPPLSGSHSSNPSELIIPGSPWSKALDGFGNWGNYGNFTLKDRQLQIPYWGDPPWASCQPGTMASGSHSPPPECKVVGRGWGVVNRRPPSADRGGGQDDRVGLPGIIFLSTTSLASEDLQSTAVTFTPSPFRPETKTGVLHCPNSIKFLTDHKEPQLPMSRVSRCEGQARITNH